MNGRIQDVYPLAPGQGGLLAQSLGGAPGAYVVQIALDLEGEPDPAREAGAWQALVARHDALRTAFVWQGQPRPLQVVGRRARAEATAEDLSALAIAEQRIRLDSWQAADRARGFDLSRAPLLRVARFALGGGRHRMVVTFHHAVLDGWSIPVLLSDWMALYAGRDLPPAAPFRDLVAWAASQDRGAAAAFWRSELAGVVPSPARLPPPATPPPDRRGDISLHLPEGEAPAAAARRSGLTPAAVVQGCWGLLMARLSGGAQAVYGLARAGRPAALPGTERRAGLFLNTLPMALRLDEDATLAGWLAGLQARRLAQAPHEHLSLAEVQAAAGWTGAAALLPSAVVFENYPADPAALGEAGDFIIRAVEVREQTSLPLTLFVIPRGGLELRLLFDAGAVDPAAARLLLKDMRALLAVFRDAPATPLAAIAVQSRAAAFAAGAPPPDAGPEAAAVTLRLARLWQDLLGGPVPQAGDNFFDLGGHSLLAIALQARIGRDFGRTVEIADLFRFATLGAQAGHIARLNSGAAAPDTLATRAEARADGTRRLQDRRARTITRDRTHHA